MHHFLGTFLCQEHFYVKLVCGFKHEFYVPFHIWDVINPIDFHSIIFHDSYCTTTKQMIVLVSSVLTTTFHNISRDMLTTFFC